MVRKEFSAGEGLRHIAFIMDGNGRWAKARGLDRPEGHRVGVKTFEEIAYLCFDIGLEAVTFYAFSTENWKRSPKEIKTIMGLLSTYLDRCGDSLVEREVRFRMLGDKGGLDASLRRRIEALEERTAGFHRTLNVAINYGGRDEIVRACRTLCESGEDINSESLSRALYTCGDPDPDLIIRTAGERRLSNFLLWQASYSELYFTDVLWPDFSAEDLRLAVEDFHKRKRNYGKA